MIKGLMITPPILGRISIGKVVERAGKRLPEKDDVFTITTQIQQRDGWLLHPLHEKLVDQAPNKKLRSIPVKVLFNDPGLNLRAEYSLFDRTTGRPMCVGDGQQARRFMGDGIESVPCPSPDGCELGRKNGCKPYGRLNVAIEGQEDDCGSFIFRTTGFNSIRTLAARLAYFGAISGGLLSSLPMSLKLRAKSTTQSHRAPVYYVDLTVREGQTLNQAVTEAKKTHEERIAAGIDQVALEVAAKEGFANGQFEDSEEEIPAIVEEFFAESSEEGTAGTTVKGLASKLESKVQGKAA